MSLLSVSSISNPSAPQANISLNADGSVTLPVYTGNTAPLLFQAGTLWFNTAGPALQIRNPANTAWLPVGTGTVTSVSGTLPITVATATTTPVIAINAATQTTTGAIEIATLAEAATGTDATRASTPETSVPKDAAGMTGAAILPSGTTGNRPATPAVGMTRVNTTTNSPEAYVNGAWSPIQSTQSGQFAGFRNVLINGNFIVNQRRYVSGTAVAAANTYTLDRWKVLTSGQSVTFTASGNGNQVTAPAGGLQQVIEALNVGGGVYTLSWAGTATATVNGTPVVSGGQVTLPANTQATVTFSNGTVSNAQLEPGGVATPFEQRTVTIETVMCMRYFQWLSYTLAGAQIYAGQNIYVMRSLPVKMRANPATSFVNTTTSGAINNPPQTLTASMTDFVLASNSFSALNTNGLCTGDCYFDSEL